MTISRRVSGHSVEVTEKIKKSAETANIKTETVIRKTVKVLVLECGHKIPLTAFNIVPSQQTRCKQCEELEK